LLDDSVLSEYGSRHIIPDHIPGAKELNKLDKKLHEGNNVAASEMLLWDIAWLI